MSVGSNPLSGHSADRIDDGYERNIALKPMISTELALQGQNHSEISICFFSVSRYKETSMCNTRNDSDQEHVPAVLSRREVLKPVRLDRQRQIFDASPRLIEVVLENRTVDQGMLKTYARTMAPLMLKNADEAGCFQVQGKRVVFPC